MAYVDDDDDDDILQHIVSAAIRYFEIETIDLIFGAHLSSHFDISEKKKESNDSYSRDFGNLIARKEVQLF